MQDTLFSLFVALGVVGSLGWVLWMQLWFRERRQAPTNDESGAAVEVVRQRRMGRG